jgi:hypothetical protein
MLHGREQHVLDVAVDLIRVCPVLGLEPRQ